VSALRAQLRGRGVGVDLITSFRNAEHESFRTAVVRLESTDGPQAG
jgi:hypothetical protein